VSTNGSSKSGTSKASQFGWLDTSSIVNSVGYQNAVKMVDAAHKFAVEQSNLNAYVDKQIEPALAMLKQATAMDASPALKAYELAVSFDRLSSIAGKQAVKTILNLMCGQATENAA